MNTYDLKGNKRTSFYKESIDINLTYIINESIEENIVAIFVIEAVDLGMTIMSVSTKDKIKLANSVGVHNISCVIDISNFSFREYSIRVSLSSNDMLVNYDTWYDSSRFYIESNNIEHINLDTNSIIISDYKFIQKN
ncbi:MAG: hypothetical protein ACK4IX_09760 [Candidatus Sericytochromatia bacterium]